MEVRDLRADTGKGLGWGRMCLILGCTAPADPLGRLRRVGAPETAPQGWRTSHFQGPKSPRPEGRWTARGGSRTPAAGQSAEGLRPAPSTAQASAQNRQVPAPAPRRLGLGGAGPPASPVGRPRSGLTCRMAPYSRSSTSRGSSPTLGRWSGSEQRKSKLLRPPLRTTRGLSRRRLPPCPSSPAPHAEAAEPRGILGAQGRPAPARNCQG